MRDVLLELGAGVSIAPLSLNQLCRLSLGDRSSYILSWNPKAFESAILELEASGIATGMNSHRLAFAVAFNVAGELATEEEVNRPRTHYHGYTNRWPSDTAWPLVWSALVKPLGGQGATQRTHLSELALSVACEHRRDWRIGASEPVDTADAARAFEFLYERDKGRVLAFCRRLPQGIDGPEAIANEAWMRAFRDHWSADATHRFLGLCSISSLICEVARNVNVDAYRKHLKTKVGATSSDEETSAVMNASDGRPGPYATVMGRQLGSRLRECIRRLPAKRQIVAEMVWFQEMSAKMVSQRLRVSEAAISQHLQKARTSVRNCLKVHGFPAP